MIKNLHYVLIALCLTIVTCIVISFIIITVTVVFFVIYIGINNVLATTAVSSIIKKADVLAIIFSHIHHHH